MLDFITLICGFGRCGSSLVMQMLEAGGMPVTGAYPAFEHPETLNRGGAWLQQQVGKAVKVLDPQRGGLPHGPKYRVIWLDRERTEQGRSQAKFVRLMMGLPGGRQTARAFAQSYVHDRPKAHAVFKAAGAPVLCLTFEGLLRSPYEAADLIAEFINPDLNAQAMARVVLPRPLACMPDMAIEARLMASRPNARMVG